MIVLDTRERVLHVDEIEIILQIGTNQHFHFLENLPRPLMICIPKKVGDRKEKARSKRLDEPLV